MEIHEAISDFSEDQILDYLKQLSEAVGNFPSEYSGCHAGEEEDSCDSEGDYVRRGGGGGGGGGDESTKKVIDSCDGGRSTPTKKGCRKDEDSDLFRLRVKDRAKSIDSGVCVVDPRKEKPKDTENAERERTKCEYSKTNLEEKDQQQSACAMSLSVAGCGGGASRVTDSDDSEEDNEKDKTLVLSFKKGDVFAVLCEDGGAWWGVMALRTAAVGYVPRAYLKFVEVRQLWLTCDGEKSSREVQMRALSELQQAASRLPHPEVVYGAMIPEPDYSDDERETHTQHTTPSSVTTMVARNNTVNTANNNNKEQMPPPPSQGQGRIDDRGLIMPKKLVNPCLESSDKKNLHRELMFNQKMGVSVLNQKTELQKAIEKHNDKKVLKEQEKEKQAQLTPFQKILDERAQRLEKIEKSEEEKDSENEKPSCEFQKIHAKVRAKMEVQ